MDLKLTRTNNPWSLIRAGNSNFSKISLRIEHTTNGLQKNSALNTKVSQSFVFFPASNQQSAFGPFQTNSASDPSSVVGGSDVNSKLHSQIAVQQLLIEQQDSLIDYLSSFVLSLASLLWKNFNM